MSHLLELRDWLDAEISRLKELRSEESSAGVYSQLYGARIEALRSVIARLDQQIAKAAAGLPVFSNPPPFGGWRDK